MEPLHSSQPKTETKLKSDFNQGALAAVVVCVLLLGGGYYFLQTERGEREFSGDVPLEVVEEKAVVDEDAPAGKVVLSERYQEDVYRFALHYPKGYTVNKFDEGNGAATLVFQYAADARTNFQIFMEPIELEGIGRVTPEEVHEAFPAFPVIDPIYVTITDTVDGLLFFSESPEWGRTRELWMARDGHLFQITTRAENDALLADMMSTWEFLP